MQFNKMFVMIPVMLAARKIDAENPTIIYWLRVAYAVIQIACVLIVAFVYWKSAQVAGKSKIVYVPPPPMPFGDPNAKKKYTEIAYGAHVISQARSLVGSTLFGIAMTLGLHFYNGMITGVAIQTLMAPLNLAENPLVKAVLIGAGIREEDKIFDEKVASELTADDEIVDDKGQPVVRAVTNNSNSNSNANTSSSSSANGSGVNAFFETVLLDTWDAGVKADLTELKAALTEKNCNYQTKDDRWTPLMILAGLCVPDCGSAIRLVQELGADPSLVDQEGWTACHWAAFHGNVEAAKELRNHTAQLTVKDKEGLTPIETARKEKNDEVAKLYETALSERKKDK